MDYDIYSLLRDNGGSGERYTELDLMDLCPSPATWSKVNGEDRKYKKYTLSSFLRMNGYELVFLVFSFNPRIDMSFMFQRLSGLCIGPGGNHRIISIPAARCFSAYGEKEPWLRDMYFSSYSGRGNRYCPDDAHIWFQNLGGEIVKVQWYELLLDISSVKGSPVYQVCTPCGGSRGLFSGKYELFRDSESEECGYEGYHNWEYEDAFEHAYYGEVYAEDEYGEGGWELK